MIGTGDSVKIEPRCAAHLVLSPGIQAYRLFQPVCRLPSPFLTLRRVLNDPSSFLDPVAPLARHDTVA